MKSNAEKFEQELIKVLRLRFDGRNRQLKERFTEEKERFNASGMLYSTEMVKALYKVLITEFKESSLEVITTATDVMNKQDVLPAEKKQQNLCSVALTDRKDELEAIYLSNVNQIQETLINKEMLKPYMSLAEAYDLQLAELHINLSNAREKYVKDRGGNRTNMIKHKFLNYRFVAWGVIVIAAVLAFIGFVTVISKGFV
jgi:hypothetical protein